MSAQRLGARCSKRRTRECAKTPRDGKKTGLEGQKAGQGAGMNEGGQM